MAPGKSEPVVEAMGIHPRGIGGELYKPAVPSARLGDCIVDHAPADPLPAHVGTGLDGFDHHRQRTAARQSAVEHDLEGSDHLAVLLGDEELLIGGCLDGMESTQ